VIVVRRKVPLAGLGVLLLGLGLATVAAAAGDSKSDIDFRGINALRVTTSPVPPGAIDCNIDNGALVHDLEQQLATGGLKVTTSGDNVATVTVLSTSETTRGICSSAIMLGAYSRMSFFDEAAGWLRSGYVVVWQSGLIVTSSPAEHLKTVRQALARLGTAMLRDWQKQNPAASK
jgi:hypothetical protein